MKLKKTILGLAVVAVAGVNAWLANDVNARNNVLSMLNLENVADASECLSVEDYYLNGDHVKTVYILCNNVNDKSCTAGSMSCGEVFDPGYLWPLTSTYYFYSCSGEKSSWTKYYY